MKAHSVFYSQDYDHDGFEVQCPKWLWTVHVISDGDPLHCPMCGTKLGSPAHKPSGKEAGRGGQ